MKRTYLTIAATAAALTAGAGLAHAATQPQAAHGAQASVEKCYGVALAGKNDCAAGPGTTCAGTSVATIRATPGRTSPAGTCTTIQTPRGNGSLTAIANR